MSLAQHSLALDCIFSEQRLLPVLSLRRLEQVLPLADALLAGGIHTLEITLRTDCALAAIRLLRSERPQLCVGAGTVLDGHQFQSVLDAGAAFVVTPGSTEELLTLGLDSPVPLLPGVATASEILMGYRFGYRRFKFYPAEISGGAAALRAFSGPFQGIRFCPTGGIGLARLGEYLALDNLLAIGGTWMAPQALIEAQDWQGITRLCQQSLALQAGRAAD